MIKDGSRNPESDKPTLRVVDVESPEEQSLDALRERARELEKDPLAKSSIRAYENDWKHFASWCRRHKLESLPATAETLKLYLTDYQDRYKIATLERRLVAISQVHEAGGHESPTSSKVIRNAMRNLRRRKQGVAQRQMSPILVEDLEAMIAALPRRTDGTLTLTGHRDRLLLLLGWAGGFRRSEIVALNVPDVRVVREGLIVTIKSSKTDQEGRGERVAIPFGTRGENLCPVAAFKSWTAAAGLRVGPLFIGIDRHQRLLLGKRLSSYAVAIIVKRTAESIGLDPTQYAGHSLRAGLATAAARGGAAEREIMRQLRQRSEKTVRKYIREADLFRNNAASKAGL